MLLSGYMLTITFSHMGETQYMHRLCSDRRFLEKLINDPQFTETTKRQFARHDAEILQIKVTEMVDHELMLQDCVSAKAMRAIEPLVPYLGQEIEEAA